MRRAFYLYLSLAAAVSLALFACVQDYVDPHNPATAPGSLSVDEAKAFFESQVSGFATRAGHLGEGQKRGAGLDPGHFAPQWDAAVASANTKAVALDMPINAKYRFRATRTEVVNWVVREYSVDVAQKLAVFKKPSKGSMSMLMVTLIPSKGYYKSHKNDFGKRFSVFGDKGGFSGVAIYSNVERGGVIRAEAYEDGKLVRMASLSGDPAQREQRVRNFKAITAGILLRVGTNQTATRSLGENNGGWTGCTYCENGCEKCDVLIDPVEVTYCSECGTIGCGGDCFNKCPHCEFITCSGDCQLNVCPICIKDPCECPCPNCRAKPCICC